MRSRHKNRLGKLEMKQVLEMLKLEMKQVQEMLLKNLKQKNKMSIFKLQVSEIEEHHTG
jgi:hypothetical protein